MRSCEEQLQVRLLLFCLRGLWVLLCPRHYWNVRRGWCLRSQRHYSERQLSAVHQRHQSQHLRWRGDFLRQRNPHWRSSARPARAAFPPGTAVSSAKSVSSTPKPAVTAQPTTDASPSAKSEPPSVAASAPAVLRPERKLHGLPGGRLRYGIDVYERDWVLVQHQRLI